MSEDKWSKINPTGKGKRGLAGGREGAEGEKSSAADRPKITATRRKQAAQYLKEITPSQISTLLTANSSQLTARQKAFAYHVAEGATKADAYRKAGYSATSKRTMACKPYELIKDERIQREIDAYKLAAEAAKHRTASDLRNLVIQSLTQQIIDPETPPAVRTMAIKTLGQVTEVAAFTERKESVVHHTSDKLRAEIFAQVQALMSGQTVEGERIEQDAASLMAELTAPQDTAAHETGSDTGSDGK
jgi:phage terminase small subunit